MDETKHRTRVVFLAGGIVLLAMAIVLSLVQVSWSVTGAMVGAGLAAIIASFFVGYKRV
jgi:hypothetical protein